MTGPIVAIGALGAIGVKKQPAFGTPAAPTATAGLWSYLLANTLKYDRGLTVQEVGAGALDPTQYIESEKAKSMGGFDIAVTGRTGINLLAYFLGVGSDAINTTGVFTGLTNHVMTPQIGLQFVTIEDQFVSTPSVPDGQSYRLDDCVLDTFDLAYTSGKGWSLKFSVLGGLGSTSISPPTVPTFPSPADSHIFQWGHVLSVTLPSSVPIKHVTNLALSGKRNTQQVFGGGSFNATDAASGKFNVTGSFDCVFGTAAAASAYAAWVADTEESIGWTIGYGDVTAATTARKLVVAATRARMIAPTKSWNIGSLTVLQVPWTVLDSANNLTLTAVTPDAGAYT